MLATMVICCWRGNAGELGIVHRSRRWSFSIVGLLQMPPHLLAEGIQFPGEPPLRLVEVVPSRDGTVVIEAHVLARREKGGLVLFRSGIIKWILCLRLWMWCSLLLPFMVFPRHRRSALLGLVALLSGSALLAEVGFQLAAGRLALFLLVLMFAGTGTVGEYIA